MHHPALNPRTGKFKCQGLSFTSNPYVIHPYFTGRDKGAVHGGDGWPLLFSNEGRAWMHVFSSVQPNDSRAADNYRVIPYKQYIAE